MKSLHVATEQTAAFVAWHVQPPASLLEIGCGGGDLAAELLTRGYRVTAVESDPAAARAARRRDVPVVIAEWPRFQSGPFDAILFSRSLHHIPDLAGAVEAAQRMLARGGMLLVEDFAYETSDQATVSWLAELLRDADARGILDDADDLVSSAVSLERWRASHDEHLHTANAMERALRSRFVIVSVATVPYLYRYLARSVSDQRWLRDQYAAEEIAGRRSEIRLLGRRYVARHADHLPVEPPLPAEAGRGSAKRG